MAFTDIASVMVPNLFEKSVVEAVTAKSALLSSGAIITSNEMVKLASQDGSSGTLPTFPLQPYSDPDLAKDDNTQATVTGIAMKPQIYQKDYISKTWGEAELAATLSGEDILGHVRDNVAVPYFVETYNRYFLAKAGGIIKDNIANDGGDMVKNFATDATGAIGAGEVASIDSVTEALASMGDNFGKLQMIAMHSRVFFNLLKKEPTNTYPASATQPFATYLGLPVLIDDSLPADVGTNRTTYTTYLLGRGFMAFGEAPLGERSVFVHDDGKSGNGWGLSTLTLRKQFIMSAPGFSSSATVAAKTGSPTMAAYNTATAWDRVVQRKNALIVALTTNG